jgi:hypothetical protein
MAKLKPLQVSVVLLGLCLTACGCNDSDSADNSNNSQSLDKTPLYSLGGSVSGLTNGKLLKLAANEETLSLNSNGEFGFSQTLKSGSAFNIRIQQLPENMKCVLEKASGIATANVSDISVSCYTPVPSSGISSDQCYSTSSNALVKCNDPTVVSLNAEQDGTRSSINPMDFGTLTQGANTYSSSECVKDKLTGLLWEIKTADGGPQMAGCETTKKPLQISTAPRRLRKAMAQGPHKQRLMPKITQQLMSSRSTPAVCAALMIGACPPRANCTA